MNQKVSIIIPFYQQREGILSKAVNSALKQKNIDDLEIIVVDDSSPIPASTELGRAIGDNPGRIKIIERPNGGPAAARNTGLDNVGNDVEYVAFLDSDDEWMDTHLVNALSALSAGYDFYFSDHYQLNQSVSAFNRAKRISLGEHPNICRSNYLYEYSGDMFSQILFGNIIGTSTVVYRYKKFPQMRFREEFVYAGEDYLFWFEMSKLTNRIAFSSLCECVYGEGVNLFTGSGWGTEKSLIRLHHQIKFQKSVSRLFTLSREQQVFNDQKIRGLRESFVRDVLHRLLHRKGIDKNLLKNQFKVDPKSFVYFLPICAAILFGSIAKSSSDRAS